MAGEIQRSYYVLDRYSGSIQKRLSGQLGHQSAIPVAVVIHLMSV